MSDPIKFSERHIPRGEGNVYARDYAGASPAFVLMHGFPDNLHIWDDLVPYLVELCWNLGDGVNQAADISWVATSIPSRNFTPRTIFGN
jgi:hypothetical protein